MTMANWSERMGRTARQSFGQFITPKPVYNYVFISKVHFGEGAMKGEQKKTSPTHNKAKCHLAATNNKCRNYTQSVHLLILQNGPLSLKMKQRPFLSWLLLTLYTVLSQQLQQMQKESPLQ